MGFPPVGADIGIRRGVQCMASHATFYNPSISNGMYISVFLDSVDHGICAKKGLALGMHNNIRTIVKYAGYIFLFDFNVMTPFRLNFLLTYALFCIHSSNGT